MNAAEHAIRGLASASDAVLIETRDAGRHVIEGSLVTIDTLVVPTGSMCLRIQHSGMRSLAILHNHEPFGRSVIRTMRDAPMEGIATVIGASRAMVPVSPDRWSWTSDAEVRHARLVDALTAAAAACVVRDPELDYAECMLAWDGSQPLPSFAQSGSMQAPTSSEVMDRALRSIGPIHTACGSRTWQVFGPIMGGEGPEWGDAAHDGITFDQETTIAFDVPDALSRMRAISAGAAAADRLGIDIAELVEDVD